MPEIIAVSDLRPCKRFWYEKTPIPGCKKVKHQRVEPGLLCVLHLPVSFSVLLPSHQNLRFSSLKNPLPKVPALLTCGNPSKRSR